MSEVEIQLAGPLHHIDELSIVKFLVEDKVGAELWDVELQVLPRLAAAGVYSDLFHHFAVQLAIFDEEGHQHVPWANLLVLAHCLLETLHKSLEH